MTRITGSQFQCLSCHLHFAGPRAYQLHFRDGECLPADALATAGLELTPWGFWAATLHVRKKHASTQGDAA